MRGPGAIIAVAVALVALVVVIAPVLSGGGDNAGTTTTPVPAEAPTGGTTPPSIGGLPPEFVECMEDQGIDAESIPDQIHSAEGDACFNSLHGGGG